HALGAPEVERAPTLALQGHPHVLEHREVREHGRDLERAHQPQPSDVGLPAPLGPMSAWMVERRTLRSTFLSATNPRNSFVKPCVSRMTLLLLLFSGALDRVTTWVACSRGAPAPFAPDPFAPAPV